MLIYYIEIDPLGLKVITTLTSVVSSNLVMGIIATCCVAFLVMIVFSDAKKWPNVVAFNHPLIVFTMPLLIIFIYLIILKAIDIISN